MKFKSITLVLMFVFVFSLSAQKTLIPIETKNVAIVLLSDDNSMSPKIIYSGKRLNNKDEYVMAANLNRMNHEGGKVGSNAFAVAGGDNNFSTIQRALKCFSPTFYTCKNS